MLVRRRAGRRGGLGRRRGLERGAGDGRTAPTPAEPCSARAWPAPWPSRPPPTAPRTASRSSAASASPGSTTRTSTSSGPWPPAPGRRRATSASLEHEVTALAAAGAPPRPRGRPPGRGRGARDEVRAVVAAGRRGADRPSGAALAEAGLITPHWPAPVGPGRLAPRAARHRRGAGRGRGAPARISAVGAWALPTLIAHGTAGAAGALGRPDAARRAQLVPALQRARRRLRPGRAHHDGPRASRAAGCSTARRCGRRWPAGRLGHLPGPHRPRRAQARGHHVLHGRHDSRRASTSGRCAS